MSDYISREVRYGLFSCLLGTAFMDLVLVIQFYLTGQPLDTSLLLYGSIIGGGIVEGVVMHVLFGTGLGILYGLSITRFDSLRIDSMGKGMKIGIMWGLVTIPLGCVPFALVTSVPLTEMIPFVTLPHLTWGSVMGYVSSHLILGQGD